jgi:hypothetical protein
VRAQGLQWPDFCLNYAIRNREVEPGGKKMQTTAERLTEMVNVTRQYCALIDGVDHAANDWLEELFRLLPRLHAAVTGLAASGLDDHLPGKPDLDARFELYSRLRSALGDRDSYWLEFDTGDGQSGMSGSLADDLTDIYFDLQRGLELLESAWPQDAVQVWKSSYRLHWGQHLVDAERHLYALKIRNRLANAEDPLQHDLEF